MRRLPAYLWAAPNTLPGLLAAAAAVLSGGEGRVVAGVLEVAGGKAGRRLLRLLNARAVTLGHVVLGWDRRSLDWSRRHERVHVRQAERWGPFFLPAYLAAGLLARVRGRHFYRDNWFERDAVRRSGG